MRHQKSIRIRGSIVLALTFCGLLVTTPQQARALGEPRLVHFAREKADFPLVHAKGAPIFVDDGDYPGVIRAATDFQGDIAKVTGRKLDLIAGKAPAGEDILIIGTLGRSKLLEQMSRERKIDVRAIHGKWESFVIQTVEKPFPNVARALVIAGSDRRGTIYGIYTLSEQIGVSPWYRWADVPIKHQEQIFIKSGRYSEGPPAVKYRGIFINDEGPCLMTWARQKYGELNHGMYTNMFELILRVKGNYLWPAMWDNSFATDDPLNPKLADEYGVIISTSHHEPMMRAWKEWERAGHKKGSWDYSKNAEVLQKFWKEGVRRTKDYEKVITIGMRGDGDEPMSQTESISLLQRIVADQRRIIGDVMKKPAQEVPQVWALYKEVQGYYEQGMRVPEDVTLLWCDDNWGNLRRLPTAEERKRPGAAGIYYHFDYVGGPRNYKWINTIPLPKVWEQMNLARAYGADRLWIVNVGDLKPLELPMEFFLSLAWNPERWGKDGIAEFMRLWAEREFGPEHAAEIADIVSKYTKYNGRRKPELLEPDTYSLENYGEADRILSEWRDIVGRAERIYASLPAGSKDAFFELVLYPTKASAVVNELYISVARNRYYAAKGDVRANSYAKRARELFAEDAKLADYYNHQLAGGKWNHMMDQTHIGYTGWQQPDANSMPKVVELKTVTTSSEQTLINATQFSKSFSRSSGGGNGGEFMEIDGYISIEAQHFFRKVYVGKTGWEVLPDNGRTLSGMTIFPVTAASVSPPGGSPRLEYPISLASKGSVEVSLILSPSLNFAPERGVRIGLSMDSEAPQILTVVPKGYRAGDGNRDWEKSVEDNARIVKCRQPIKTAGSHTLKVWMADPGVVLQKI
ncbi:MAG TPA: glycosyl hydrolase 115 family protein, partial [Candidatus Dormibacteraeota bacterium]|nr:glycosyl hydrolase 115 family protein [Candidatus Dormibacteraeota bacterium]